MKKDFSIVIPTLNSEKFLKETILSIEKQDKSIMIECIFSDGGSTDKTMDIIKDFNQDNIRKIVILNKIGMSKALNEGFKISNAKYLTYLNSDDKLEPNALKIVKENFENSLDADWIIGKCENFGKLKYLNKFLNFYKNLLMKNLNYNILCINNVISQPSVFWKYEFFKVAGSFDEKLKFNMDYDLWLRMIKISKPKILTTNLSYFRRHSNSLSHTNSFSQFSEKFKTMKKYNKNIIIHFLHLFLSSMILFIYKITNY